MSSNFKAALAGGPGGAWADDVEAEESSQGAPLANQSEFPSLGEASKVKDAGKKKEKPKKMSLTDFMSGGGSAAGFADKSLNDKAILAALPTASRGLPREDARPGGGLGGGFRDYGGDRDGARGGFRREDGDRPPRRGEEDMGPSRADAVSDWGTMRKFAPGESGPSRGFGGGGGGGFGGPRDGPREPREFRPSAADEVDSWGGTKKFEPSAGPSGRGGFEDRPRGGFRDGPPREDSRADQEDQWSRGREFKPAEGSAGPSRGPRVNGGDFGSADREDRWSRKPAPAADEAAPSSSAAAGPGERPKLKLAPRTAAPAAGEASSSATAKSSLFGAARPREEVLKEKGVDPIKEQLKLEHGDVQREETAEEKALKQEVEELRKQLDELKASKPDDEETQGVAKQVDEKEKALYKLMAELDDKVKFKKQDRERSRERDNAAAAPAKPRW